MTTFAQEESHLLVPNSFSQTGLQSPQTHVTSLWSNKSRPRGSRASRLFSSSCESTSGLRDRPVELRPPVEICSTGLKCHDTTSCSPIQKCKLHSTSLAGLRRGSRTTAVRNFRSDRVLPCGTLTERAKQQNSGAPFYLLGTPPCLASQYNLPPASRHALKDRPGEARFVMRVTIFNFLINCKMTAILGPIHRMSVANNIR